MSRIPSGAVLAPPDGGWGWMVLIGAFMSYFLADGWSYSFGVLFPSLLEVFGESKGKTSLIAALLYGVPLLLSPIVCALAISYGCRIIAIIGGLLTAASMILTAFAFNITQICVTIGLLGSLGLAMAYLSALIIVTFYFDKRRGLATGLAVTGSGLGSIFFPLIMEFLMEKYLWRGFLLILGALCLHIVLAGFLFRAPPFRLPTETSATKDAETEPPPKRRMSFMERNELHSVILLPRLKRQAEDDILSQSCKDISQTVKINNAHVIQASKDQPDGDNSSRIVLAMRFNHQDQKVKSVSTPDVFDASTVNFDISSNEEQLIDSDNSQYPARKSRTRFRLFLDELRIITTSLVDKSLAKNWSFLLFSASNFILYLWIGVPYIFLIDRAMKMDLKANDQQIYFLASIIGIGRTVGQIFLGFLGDIPQINCNTLYAVSIIIVGVDTLMVPLCTSYAMFCVFAAVFGFFVSATYAIQMMCVVDIVGLDKTTNAFGILQLLQGIATILGTPLAGWLYDTTGAYDPTFYTAGAWMLLSGIIMLPVKRLLKTQHKFIEAGD